ncbi:MAG: exo-alpha-sialidase, partial [Ignavibacteriae bacterium]|nr:exo-alpha-sialidase [Ignavibacteriota bacterium]
MKKTIFFALLFISIAFAVTNISAQWQPEVRMTNDTLTSLTSFGNARCIAANGDVIHAVWYSGDGVNQGSWQINYKRSTDKGVTWSAAVNLTNSDSIRCNPAIAVSGSYVHVVWYDKRDGNTEEYYKRSTDGGITWGPDIRLTNNTAGSGHPSIAASGLNLHVVWYDGRDGNNEIYYKRSVDGGDNWSADTRLSITSGHSFMPAVAVSGSVVHVAWCDSVPGNWKIYYKRSVDGGITWGADTP